MSAGTPEATESPAFASNGGANEEGDVAYHIDPATRDTRDDHVQEGDANGLGVESARSREPVKRGRRVSVERAPLPFRHEVYSSILSKCSPVPKPFYRIITALGLDEDQATHSLKTGVWLSKRELDGITSLLADFEDDAELLEVPGIIELAVGKEVTRAVSDLQLPVILMPSRTPNGMTQAIATYFIDVGEGGVTISSAMLTSNQPNIGYSGPKADASLHFTSNTYKEVDALHITIGVLEAEVASAYTGIRFVGVLSRRSATSDICTLMTERRLTKIVLVHNLLGADKHAAMHLGSALQTIGFNVIPMKISDL